MYKILMWEIHHIMHAASVLCACRVSHTVTVSDLTKIKLALNGPTVQQPYLYGPQHSSHFDLYK